MSGVSLFFGFEKKKLITFFKLLVSFVFVLFLIKRVDFEQLKLLDITILPVFLLSVLITLCALFMMAVRWSFLCEVIKIKPSVLNLYSFYLKASFYNTFLPGAIGGDIFRTKDLMNKYSVTLKKATLLTLAERFSGLYMLFLLLGFGVVLGKLPGQIQLPISNSSFYGLLIVVVLAIPLLKKLTDKKVKMSYNTIFSVLLFSVLAQLGDVCITYLFCNYFHIEITFFQLLVVMPIVYFATVLPISLGGLGVREGVFVAMLALYNSDTSIAVIISIMVYFVKIMVGIVGWGTYMLTKNDE